MMMPRPTLLSVMLLGLTGCATPGPLHVYTLGAGAPEIVRDHPAAGGDTHDWPAFGDGNDGLTGFAYDPYTDHFFLRLAPGSRIRVVDRPARAIKREFTIAGAPESGGGDLAARPRDGHLFLVHPSAPALLETTRLGKLVRTIPLEGMSGPPAGVAVDTGLGRLAVLHADGRRITFHEGDGAQVSAVQLDRAVINSLAFDSERREFHAPLLDSGGTVAVFDENGRLLRTATSGAAFVDLGPRSFIRIF